MIRATRWAISPLDCAVHLLMREGDHPLGVFQARCGHLLPTVVHQRDQPPPGTSCEDCRLIFLADCALHAAAAQLAGALQRAPDSGWPPVEPAPVMLPAAGRPPSHNSDGCQCVVHEDGAGICRHGPQPARPATTALRNRAGHLDWIVLAPDARRWPTAGAGASLPGRCSESGQDARGPRSGGIFSGMFSTLDPDIVLAHLGDKVVHAFSRSVHLTREDLATYRSFAPGWVAMSSERGLASWIHDRMWTHAVGLVEGVDGVAVVDKEPTREIFVGTRYRIRLKRHQDDGAVSMYPTPTALDFLGQGGEVPLPGLEEVCLIAGYEWNREARQIGVAVLSLRSSGENIVWVVELPTVGELGDGGQVVRPTVPGPTQPTVSVLGGAAQTPRTEGTAGSE